MTTEWTPDDSQRAVINARGGCHLVLAPPGCGKTQILSERVWQAHERGIGFDDMLCLTFTNRAARGMQERISGRGSAEGLENLYVGNIHRFCSKYLFDNNLIEAGTSVIDDDDALSILARYLDEEEDSVMASYNKRNEYHEIIHFSHLMHQMRNNHPRYLRLHAECMTQDDVLALRTICSAERLEFSLDTVIDIYDHNDHYLDEVRNGNYDNGLHPILIGLLRKMRFAHAFTAYCKQNQLIDFEDLLLLTYDALRSDGDHKRYHWIQVDEVQDLNPLQLEIIDLLSTVNPSAPSAAEGEIIYLGDEQQAIFSFMGAKMDTLEALKERCRGNIHHLNVNHRSPSYLLDVFNEYARCQLGISGELLPSANDDSRAGGNDLRLLASDTVDGEYADVAQLAANLYNQYPHETTAVITSSNADADRVSEEMTRLALPHFKVSGVDIFSTPEVKLLLAHFNVIANDNNFICWARILKGFGVFMTNAAARDFTHKLFVRAMTPSDFLTFDEGTYTQHFADDYEHEEFVLFDTETTGLSVFDDDILQIAAIKVRNGRKIEGSDFCIYIETEREIPQMLGQTVNPIIEERRRHRLYSHREALEKFIAYAGNDILVGHNVEYDYRILGFNLDRYTDIHDLERRLPHRYDTLKLLRLLEPGLHGYRLDDFRARHLFGIKADDAHLADVDVSDTLKVLRHCYQRARELSASQSEFLSIPSNAKRISTLRKNYMNAYMHTRGLLYDRMSGATEPVVVSEMRKLYQRLVEEQRIKKVDKLDHVLEYLRHDILRPDAEPSLVEQLQKHVMEINTLKEADLCNATTLNERVFVSTVHKAKGLEFDNIIVFDAVDGRYPNFYNQNNQKLLAEDKRKFYVAISRAKKRLFISRSLTRIDYRGNVHSREITPFMKEIMRFFTA